MNTHTNFRRILTSASVAAICWAAAPVAGAQTITGKVTDSSGQAPFEGAIVTIDELGRKAATNRFGEYRLSNIPAGVYTISTSYIGTDTVRNTIDVPQTGTNLNIVLGQDVDYIDNIIVVGTRAAQAGALNQQRAADSIKTVIDSDGLGNFPDTTVADSLQRAVGMSIETDQGEGRYVSIRGINTDLIATSINGVRTPSPEDRRGVLLDGVPSDLLEGIEIQKSLTPDVDADSLGGVINLKTISAFDRDGRFVRAKLEGRYNDITKEVSPKGTLTYSEVFNDDFGLAVSVNYQDLAIESHNNESGGWGTEGGQNFFMNDDYEQRWYDLNRKRLGLVANMDWNVSDTTRLYLRTLYNHYTDDEVRNKFEYRDLDDGAATSGTTSVVPINEMDAEVRLRKEIRKIQTYAVGGETDLGDWNLNYELAYAQAEEDDSDNHDVTFRYEDIQDNGVGNITFNTATPQTPVISGAVALASVFDPANYVMDELEQEDTLNEDQEYSARLDISRDAMFGETPVTWKFGGKYRDRQKTRDVNKTFYGADDLSLAGFVGERLRTNWRLSNHMPAFPDPYLTAALRNNALGNLELDEDATNFDSLSEDFEIKEKVLAGYVMGTFDLGQATVVAGARVENTNIDMKGNNFAEEDNPANVTVLNYADDYTHFLPSLNVKYDFTDKVIGRAAYYASVVRPAFGDVAPYAILNDDRDEAVLGNPNLKPYEADNFDVALEFYPNALSVISVGGFYKTISNAIYPVVYEIGDVPAGFDLNLLTAAQRATVEEIETTLNIDSVDLYGVEFNFVQDLALLNDAMDGFLVTANLTLTDSEATIPDGEGTREVPFLKQADTVWNVALAYDKGPWDLRVSANYRGDYLDEIISEGGPGDPEYGNLDRYTDDRMIIEASAKYKFNDNFQVYVEGKNLTDEPEYYYFGNESRLSQYDEFGRTVIFGVRYTY